jgi:hypothetical protein
MIQRFATIFSRRDKYLQLLRHRWLTTVVFQVLRPYSPVDSDFACGTFR